MMSETNTPRGCLWPMWSHEARPSHEYCGCTRLPGSSYCAEHFAKSIRSSEDEVRTPFIPHKKAA